LRLPPWVRWNKQTNKNETGGPWFSFFSLVLTQHATNMAPNPHDAEQFVVSSAFLVGTIPSEVGNCKSLEHFDVQHNLLTGSIPSKLLSLDHLGK